MPGLWTSGMHTRKRRSSGAVDTCKAHTSYARVSMYILINPYWVEKYPISGKPVSLYWHKIIC